MVVESLATVDERDWRAKLIFPRDNHMSRSAAWHCWCHKEAIEDRGIQGPDCLKERDRS